MSELNAHLLELLHDAAAGLPQVTQRKLFGCEGLFARGNIFALIWKTGRIGLKVTETSAFDELLCQPGAERWAPGMSPMAHWVLVSEELHDDTEELKQWTQKAHAHAMAMPPKMGAAPKKAAVKKKQPAAKAAKKTVKKAAAKTRR